MSGFSLEEQETILRFDPKEKVWTVYSALPRHMNRLNNVGDMEPAHKDGDRIIAVKGFLDEKQVSFRKLREEMTEEQKQAAVERMRKARESK